MTENIRRRVQDLTGLSSTAITINERKRLTYQGGNLYDVRFDETHWIAKEFVKDWEIPDCAEREFNNLTLLQPLDIAPKPIDYLRYPEHQHPVVLYEFMAGEMWQHHIPTVDEFAQLADVWLKTYTLTRDDLWLSNMLSPNVAEDIGRYRGYYEMYREWASAHFPEGLTHLEMCLELFEMRVHYADKIDASNVTWLFTQSDPRFANIIARPDGRIGLIDWEDGGLRNPLRAIADMLYHPDQEHDIPLPQWDAFLNPFFENYPHPEDNPREVLHWFSAFTPLAWISGLLMFGVRRAHNNQLDDSWQVNGMPPNQRLRRYIAHALTWENGDFEAHLATTEGIRFFDLD